MTRVRGRGWEPDLASSGLRLAAAELRPRPRGAERAEDEDVGLGIAATLGPEQVAAVTGAEPAGQIELSEREEG